MEDVIMRIKSGFAKWVVSTLASHYFNKRFNKDFTVEIRDCDAVFDGGNAVVDLSIVVTLPKEEIRNIVNEFVFRN